jgi:hypothetical protein
MSTRRGQPGSSQGVSCTPLTPTVPTLSSGERGQASGRIPRQAISIVLPPPGLSWRMLGVGVAFGLLLITGLSLAALALRPRDPGPGPQSLSAQTAPLKIAAIPVAVPAVKIAVQPAVVPEKIDRPAPVPDDPEPTPVYGPEPPPPAQAQPAPSAPAPPVLKPTEVAQETCGGTCGTSVAFLASPQQAARRAAEEGKVLFILHVSGNFEDPGFT